jgi:TIR domain
MTREVLLMADVAVFVSYTHEDDLASYGRIAKISADIRQTYKSLSGLEVELFFDKESIGLGEDWRDRIQAGLVDATILLAFISPLYLASAPCREELQEFISVLSDTNSQKLIIPVLFTDRGSIEERFRDDKLWAKIVTLKYLPISELRTSDPGSGKWMEQVVKVAERMMQTLPIRDASVPPPRTADSADEVDSSDADDDSELGVLEQMARFEDLLPSVTENITGIGADLGELNERVVAATPLMGAAKTSNEKLAVANSLAADLTPIVDRISVAARDYQSGIEGIDSGVRIIFKTLRATPRNEWDTDSQEFVKSVEELGDRSLEGIAAMDTFSVQVASAKGFSSKLDSPLQRLQGAILMLSGSRAIFRHWLEEVADLASPLSEANGI